MAALSYLGEDILEVEALKLLVDTEGIYDSPMEGFYGMDHPLNGKHIISGAPLSKSRYHLYPVENAVILQEAELAVQLCEKGYHFFHSFVFHNLGGSPDQIEILKSYIDASSESSKEREKLVQCIREEYKACSEDERKQIFLQNIKSIKEFLSAPVKEYHRKKFSSFKDLIYDILDELSGYEIDKIGTERAYQYFEKKMCTDSLKNQCIESFVNKRYALSQQSGASIYYIKKYLQWRELGLLNDDIFMDLFHINILNYLSDKAPKEDGQLWSAINRSVLKTAGTVQEIYRNYLPDNYDFSYVMNHHFEHSFDTEWSFTRTACGIKALNGRALIQWMRVMRKNGIDLKMNYGNMEGIWSWAELNVTGREKVSQLLEMIIKYVEPLYRSERQRNAVGLTQFDKKMIALGSTDLVEAALKKGIWNAGKLNGAIKYAKKKKADILLPYLIIRKNSSKTS